MGYIVGEPARVRNTRDRLPSCLSFATREKNSGIDRITMVVIAARGGGELSNSNSAILIRSMISLILPTTGLIVTAVAMITGV